jgi:hypothetical protein
MGMTFEKKRDSVYYGSERLKNRIPAKTASGKI